MTRTPSLLCLLVIGVVHPLAAVAQAVKATPQSGLEQMMRRYLCRLAEDYDETIPLPGSQDEWPSRQRQLRAKVRALIGLEPLPDRCPLDVRRVGTLDRGEYVIEKIVFQSWPGVFVPAAVYVPKNVPLPAPTVLNPTGHSAHKGTGYIQQRNVGLCLRGYITMTYDTVGQGERRSGAGYSHKVGVQSFLIGRCNTTYMIWDSIRALDYLCSRADVDTSRLAVTGHSGGGLNAKYLAAVDERICCSIPAGHIRTYSSMIPNWRDHCICCWTPNAMRQIRTGEICAAVAPRPQLILANSEDRIVPLEGTRRAHAEAARLYGAIGAPDRIALQEFAGPHKGYRPCLREAMYVWFDRWVRDIQRSDPAERSDGIFPQNSPELNCFAGGGNPSTSDMLTLNHQLAETLPPEDPPRDTPQAVRGWQKRHRRLVLREVIGGLPAEPWSLRPQSGPGKDSSGPTVEYVTIESERGILVPGLFIRSAGQGRSPVVLWVDPQGKDAAIHSSALGLLVDRGIAVFAVDARGWGETSPDGPRGNWIVGTATTTLGRHIAAMRAYDVMRALDYLTTRKDVDPDRIACLGIGHRGGLVCLLAAGLDERIRGLTVVEGLVWLKSYFRNRVVPPIDMAIPAVMNHTEVTHLLSLCAPRPVLLTNLTNAHGKVLSSETVNRVYGIPQSVYETLGAADRLELVVSEDRAEGPMQTAEWLAGFLRPSQ